MPVCQCELRELDLDELWAMRTEILRDMEDLARKGVAPDDEEVCGLRDDADAVMARIRTFDVSNPVGAMVAEAMLDGMSPEEALVFCNVD